MREKGFEIFLESKGYTDKSVKSRMAKARKAEQILKTDLDNIVCDDNKMFDSLNVLQKYEDPAHNPMQNSLRRYYEFINKREFPQLRIFKK